MTLSVGTTFSLEVGYNAAAKTLLVLRTHGRLARWPYGSEWIYLFAVRDWKPLDLGLPVRESRTNAVTNHSR